MIRLFIFFIVANSINVSTCLDSFGVINIYDQNISCGPNETSLLPLGILYHEGSFIFENGSNQTVEFKVATKETADLNFKFSNDTLTSQLIINGNTNIIVDSTNQKEFYLNFSLQLNNTVTSYLSEETIPHYFTNGIGIFNFHFIGNSNRTLFIDASEIKLKGVSASLSFGNFHEGLVKNCFSIISSSSKPSFEVDNHFGVCSKKKEIEMMCCPNNFCDGPNGKISYKTISPEEECLNVTFSYLKTKNEILLVQTNQGIIEIKDKTSSYISVHSSDSIANEIVFDSFKNLDFFNHHNATAHFYSTQNGTIVVYNKGTFLKLKGDNNVIHLHNLLNDSSIIVESNCTLLLFEETKLDCRKVIINSQSLIVIKGAEKCEEKPLSDNYIEQTYCYKSCNSEGNTEDGINGGQIILIVCGCLCFVILVIGLVSIGIFYFKKHREQTSFSSLG